MSEVPLYSGGAELIRLVLWRIHVPRQALLSDGEVRVLHLGFRV